MSTTKIIPASRLRGLSDDNLQKILENMKDYDKGQQMEFADFFKDKDDISGSIVLLGLEHPMLWEAISKNRMMLYERSERFMRTAFLPKVRLILYGYVRGRTTPYIKNLVKNLLNHSNENSIRFYSLLEVWQMASDYMSHDDLDEILSLVINHTHFRRDVLYKILSEVHGSIKDSKVLWEIIDKMRKKVS
jgi:hypothetical protein